MPRLPDYRSRLTKLLSDYEAVPFEYGKNDCAIWASRAIECQTGEQLFHDLFGTYSTKIGGFRKFKSETGFRSHIEYIAANYEEVAPAFAQLGDIAIIETEEGETATAIIFGAFAAGPGPEGIVRYPITKITKSYRIAE